MEVTIMTQEELITFYESRLKKVKGVWLDDKKEGSLEWERGTEYVTFAEAELKAVRNGRGR